MTRPRQDLRPVDARGGGRGAGGRGRLRRLHVLRQEPAQPRARGRRAAGRAGARPGEDRRRDGRPDDAELDAITAALGPDLIQLHGRETPPRAREIGARTGAGVIKALPVSKPPTWTRPRAFEALADHLMFDAKPPRGRRPARRRRRAVRLGPADGPQVRSGRGSWPAGSIPGTSPRRSGRSGAPLVDVSSGVERGAGLKDPRLISAFLDAVAPRLTSRPRPSAPRERP